MTSVVIYLVCYLACYLYLFQKQQCTGYPMRCRSVRVLHYLSFARTSILLPRCSVTCWFNFSIPALSFSVDRCV